MLLEYLPLLVFVGIAVAFGAFVVIASYLVGQHKPTPAKMAPYECGVTTVGSTRRRIPIRYYIVAMLFLLFDIEIVFLYPWAVVFRDFKAAFGIFVFVEMLVFLGILVVAYVYVWKKGALEWE
ncbi:MAG: NADH-quinone oxidoreductase subunit A [Deltaproteobacteria bacterium]|nr:NADH-quinone oxidoreductase subunit A [Deltaproteobacteria bacterium]MBW2120349.1 NADH-quinone oxidoreductase subunit A [Deltaproteobacteria bacterium]